MGRDGDDWMSDGNELQRRDSATGNSCFVTLNPNPNPKYMYRLGRI